MRHALSRVLPLSDKSGRSRLNAMSRLQSSSWTTDVCDRHRSPGTDRSDPDLPTPREDRPNPVRLSSLFPARISTIPCCNWSPRRVARIEEGTPASANVECGIRSVEGTSAFAWDLGLETWNSRPGTPSQMRNAECGMRKQTAAFAFPRSTRAPEHPSTPSCPPTRPPNPWRRACPGLDPGWKLRQERRRRVA